MNNSMDERHFFNALDGLRDSVPVRYFTDWNRMIEVFEENHLLGECTDKYLNLISSEDFWTLDPRSDDLENLYRNLRDTWKDPFFLRIMIQFFASLYTVKNLDEKSINGYTGIGTYRTSTFEYTGEFYRGCMDGYGHLRFLDETESSSENDENRELLGEFVKNRYIGHPVVLRRYTGDIPWKAGISMYSGQGTFMYADGSMYEGELECCIPKGNGFIKFSGGGSYSGDIFGDRADGNGILKTETNEIYSGVFVDSNYTGTIEEGKETPRLPGLSVELRLFECSSDDCGDTSTYQYPEGGIYKGEMINGLPNGRGVIKRENGDVYTGEVVDGLYHGQGVLKTSDKVYSGTFDKSEFIHGKIDFKNGTTYLGECLNGLPDGFGLMKSEYRTENGLFEKGLHVRFERSGDALSRMNGWNIRKKDIVVIVRGEYKGEMGQVMELSEIDGTVNISMFETNIEKVVPLKHVRLLERMFPISEYVRINESESGMVVSYDYRYGTLIVRTENGLIHFKPGEVGIIPFQNI